jgi:hypothetical protein
VYGPGGVGSGTHLVRNSTVTFAIVFPLCFNPLLWLATSSVRVSNSTKMGLTQ